jgi:hypothetical protein
VLDEGTYIYPDILWRGGQDGQGGAFTDEAGDVAFAFLATIKKFNDNLGQLLAYSESKMR